MLRFSSPTQTSQPLSHKVTFALSVRINILLVTQSETIPARMINSHMQ